MAYFFFISQPVLTSLTLLSTGFLFPHFFTLEGISNKTNKLEKMCH